MATCDICDGPKNDGQTVTDNVGALVERAKAAGVDPALKPSVTVCGMCIKKHGGRDKAVIAAVDRIIARAGIRP